MKITSISIIATLLTVVFSFLPVSCDKQTEPEGEKILEVSIKNPSVGSGRGEQFVSVKCNGDWTLSLTSDNGDVAWAELNTTSGTGNKSNVRLTYQVNDTEEKREVKIVLSSGLKSVECSMVQSAAGQHPEDDREDDSDEDQTVNIDLIKTGWLELPAMDDPDLGYYSHSFEMNGQTYRNYSFGWSQKDRVALWVAYPLCKFYLNGSAGRTNAWALDPLLKENSAAPFGGYAGDYARGHQIPSADRQCCYDANAQTFYGTNMTPQLNAHNEGIWQTMESKVRTLANTSDTTYVVTGCVVEGSTKFTEDSDGKKMTVPVGYYKVLLRYSKSSTISTWAAMAFYTEHKSYSNSTSLKSLAMSVDELEEMLGMDFFVNLPAKLGEARAAELEAEDPLTNSVWGL